MGQYFLQFEAAPWLIIRFLMGAPPSIAGKHLQSRSHAAPPQPAQRIPSDCILMCPPRYRRCHARGRDRFVSWPILVLCRALFLFARVLPADNAHRRRERGNLTAGQRILLTMVVPGERDPR